MTFTLGHDAACVTICGCITSWELPCSQSVETDASIVFSFLFCVFFFFVYMHFTDPVHPLSLLSFPWKGSALICEAYVCPVHTVWVDGQGQYLLSETKTPAPKPICRRFEWQILELDLGDLLCKRIIIHHMGSPKH